MIDLAALMCPKCLGEMRTYERSGVLVDQCQECRGIFLDRGELERLLDAERAHPGRDEDPGTDDSHRRGEDMDGGQRPGRRRPGATGLLADLFGGGE
jgi:uncharacterized protein